MPPRSLIPQSVWDVDALLSAFEAAGVKTLHATRLWAHMLRHPSIKSFQEVPELPKAALEVLNEGFVLSSSTVEAVHRSSDGETTKMVIRLQDGLKVESVIMLYDTRGRYKDEVQEQDEGRPMTDDDASSEVSCKPKGNVRATLCVSSQVGCQMGCTFCSTGTMGLKGNLTSGEILEQLVFANSLGLDAQRATSAERIKNVVFMGKLRSISFLSF